MLTVSVLSAFTSELEKQALHFGSPAEAKLTRKFFDKIRKLKTISIGDTAKETHSAAAADLLDRAFLDRASKAARNIRTGVSPVSVVGKPREQRLREAKDLLPLLDKRQPIPLARVRHILGGLPTDRRLIRDTIGKNPVIGKETAETLNTLKNSPLAKLYERGAKGTLRFARGTQSGIHTPRYEIDKNVAGLFKSPVGTRAAGLESARQAAIEHGLVRPASTHTPTPTSLPAVSQGNATSGSAAGGGSGMSPALLGAGAVGGLGLGYAAYRHLKKKSTDS